MENEHLNNTTDRDVTLNDLALAQGTAKGFDGMTKRFDAMDARFEKLEAKVAVMAGDIVIIKEDVKKLNNTKVSYTEFNDRLRPIEQKLGIPSPQ